MFADWAPTCRLFSTHISHNLGPSVEPLQDDFPSFKTNGWSMLINQLIGLVINIWRFTFKYRGLLTWIRHYILSLGKFNCTCEPIMMATTFLIEKPTVKPTAPGQPSGGTRKKPANKFVLRSVVVKNPHISPRYQKKGQMGSFDSPIPCLADGFPIIWRSYPQVVQPNMPQHDKHQPMILCLYWYQQSLVSVSHFHQSLVP